MEWVETTGRTIAEALDAALDELGVDEDDVEYEVLEEPKSGFLGRIGSSEGRIRARVKPISREKPGERQRRKGRGSARPRGGGNGGNGGGGNGIYSDHCWVENLIPIVPFTPPPSTRPLKMLSTRTVSY